MVSEREERGREGRVGGKQTTSKLASTCYLIYLQTILIILSN